MDTKVAVMAILVKDRESSEKLNKTLHNYGDYIIGRMGIPYRAKNINIISVILDAPKDIIVSLSAAINQIENISIKTVCEESINN